VGLAREKPRLRVVTAADASSLRDASPALDDTELLAALRAGDEAAATALHDRLRPRIETTVRRLLGVGDAEHEDCVQLTFVEIIRSIEKYRGECSLEHWATSIAAHVVYKHIRHRKAERRVFDAGARTSDRPEALSSSRRVVTKDLFDRVRRRLDELDSDKAYTFLLHDVIGFDLREIAQITGVSVAAAQGRLVRGRREVHAHLAADAELAAVLMELEVDE
jgi:RNA polymerase sigma-70 factor (ECF subfamily)